MRGRAIPTRPECPEKPGPRPVTAAAACRASPLIVSFTTWSFAVGSTPTSAGAYYTPVEVVRIHVCRIDNLPVERLGKPLGFANPDVVTLFHVL